MILLISFGPHLITTARIVALQVRNRPEAIPSIVDKLLKYTEQYPRQTHYSGKLFLVESHRMRVRRGTEHDHFT